MADKDKIPFGGRDWNKDGKYDNFDIMTDFYVYKKVTEDWKENGAWEKKKEPPREYTPIEKTEEEEFFETFISIIGFLLTIAFVWWLISAFASL